MEWLISGNTAARESSIVVSLADYRSNRKERIEEWLSKAASEQYGEEKVKMCMDNPYLRLLLKYDGLSGKEQERMLGYAEQVMAEYKGRMITQRNIFREVLSFGDFETWDRIEEFSDRLLFTGASGG